MKEHLRRVPLFADLSEDDLTRLSSGSELISLEPHEVLFAEGGDGDRAFVVVDGEVEVVKTTNDREVLLARRHAGDVIGEMALLDSAPRMATVRSCNLQTSVVSIPKDRLDELLATSATAARALFAVLMARWRQTEAQLRQSERMAQIGTLTAGLAHELNNPASAVARSSKQLGEAIREYGTVRETMARLDLDPGRLASAETFIDKARTTTSTLTALERSDREDAIEVLLRAHGVTDNARLAAELAEAGVVPGDIDALEAELGTACGAVLEAAGAVRRVFGLLHEVEEGSARLSGIVGALKGYTYLDQAPRQEIDVTTGIEDTLLILKAQLADIEIVRNYRPDVPKITAYASELNQVWTNLLSNAADAVHQTGRPGRIELRTHSSENEIHVEVHDNGSGIPADLQGRIFDAFFTTKPPGSGTGLGLDISYNIVVTKHRGDLRMTSEPGHTVFTVSLPKQLRD